MKRPLLIALIFGALVAAILFCIPDKSVPFDEPETVSGSAGKEEQQPKPANAPTPPTPGLLLPQVAMTAAIEYKIDPIALNREMEDPPFEFRGGAGTGRVIDLQGNVLLESSADIGIFGAVVSPDRKKVLVRGGDGKSLILEPSKNQKIVPPFKPPGSNSFPFDWYWVSANLLFGISGVERTFHEGSHMDGESNIAQTKFYTFDLLTGQLFEVVMPRAVTQSVVKVVDVMSDGHIHLLQDDLDEGVRQDLGWFKIAE